MITVTGATGFLGAHLLAGLLRRDDRPVSALVRDDPGAARERLLRAVRSTGARWEAADFHRRVTPVRIELAAPRLGLSAEDHRALARRTRELWHCAADTSPMGPVAALHRTNVAGTEHVLRLLDAGERSARLFHISTAFVAGERREGTVFEGTLEEGRYGFATSYEESKFRAEALVRGWARDRGRPVVVMRPGVLVTDRPAEPGEPRHWLAVQAARAGVLGRQDPSHVLRAAGLSPEDISLPYTARLPGRPDAVVNLLQVDWAAAAMLRCADACLPGRSRPASGPYGQGGLVATYHLTHPHDYPVQELLRIALEPCDWLDFALDPDLAPEEVRPLERFLMRLAAGLTPYWWARRRYDRARLDAATTGLEPPAELSAQYLRSGMAAPSPLSCSSAGAVPAGATRKGAVTAHVRTRV
ncbi:SDR family oxidoreductase [Streptomyces sp. NPDC058989]|uniref:SDR family oxidoreductase n=1 Tax=Streptomyces sp. NPDC058989 TaxID=3346686 RepID=UPI0036A1797F